MIFRCSIYKDRILLTNRPCMNYFCMFRLLLKYHARQILCCSVCKCIPFWLSIFGLKCRQNIKEILFWPKLLIRCIILRSNFTGDLCLSYLSPGNHYWPYFWSYYVRQEWPSWSKWTKMAKMTTTAWPDMAKNMANMGFHAMNRTNVDHQ